MAANLDDIDAAIFAALEGLLASAYPAGPFAQVARYAGELGRDAKIDRATLGNTPAAMLAFEGEQYAVEERARSLILGDDGCIGTSIWRVFVVTNTPSGFEAGVKGESGNAGILALVSAVSAALSGLVIEGLYESGRVRLVGTQPVYVKPGAFVYMLRVSARRFIEAADSTDDESVPLTEIDADIDVADQTVPEAEPIVQFHADTT